MPAPTLNSSRATLDIGVIGRPNGIRGALNFRPHNPDSKALTTVRELALVHGGATVTYRVKRARPGSSGAWVLELTGVDDRTAAEALTGAVVCVDPSSLPPPAEDEFYYHEVVGSRVVTRSGLEVGTVSDVMRTSTDVLVVERVSGGELMVPVVPAYVLELDTAARRVVVVDDAVELLDLTDDA